MVTMSGSTKNKNQGSSFLVGVIKYILRLIIIFITAIAMFIAFASYVFVKCGYSVNWTEVWYKLNYPDEISFTHDILHHAFPTMVSISLVLNVGFLMFIIWFKRGITQGYILLGQGGAVKG
jgi:hypothetical protein